MTREEAIKILKANYNNYSETLKEIVNKAIETVEKDIPIKALEQPKQKKGKWINPSHNPEYVNKEFFYDCSVCGFTTMQNSDICPNCGAKMEEEEERRCQ